MYLCIMFSLLRFLIFSLLLTIVSCGRPTSSDCEQDDTLQVVVPKGYNDDAYDQGKTEACWIYAMLACIETEQLRRGDSVVLSRQWLMSNALMEQTTERYLRKNGEITMRGVGKDVLRLIQQYGLIPIQMEKSRIANSRVLQRRLTLLTEMPGMDVRSIRKKMDDILPRFTVAFHGAYPKDATFYYYSMCYTPRQFAESVMYNQHWEWFASSQWHPWNEAFALEVPDNKRYHEYVNLPMDTLFSKVMASLNAGHPVYWEMSKKSDAGDSDHSLAITGLRRDAEGHTLLLCLNSYGRKWGRDGYCLITPEYFKKHTCNVGILSEK